MDKRSILFMLCVTLSFFAVQMYFDNGPKEEKKTEQVVITPPPKIITKNHQVSTPQDESFYVLENEYQQLVFSSRGGSLAEVNLPFKKDSPKSYVKEIDFDREILATSPENAYFPLHSYQTPDGQEKKRKLGGYYPLMRRGLNGKAIDPKYYALNIVGEDPSIANVNYRMTRFEPNLIEFQGSIGQARVTKTYTVPQERNGPYCFNLDIQVDGDAQGLWLSSGVPDVEIMANSYSPLLRIQLTKNKTSDVESLDLPKKGATTSSLVTPTWISNSNGFLGVIMDPLNGSSPGYKTVQVEGTDLPTRLTLIDSSNQLYPAANYPGYITYLPLQSGATPFRIFAGPYDTNLLKDLDGLYDDISKNYNPDYVSALSIQGWFSFISQPFSKFLFLLMQLFYSFTRSWAAAIVLLTIALKAMMYPLNNWTVQSQLKQKALAPKIAALKERHKKDPKKAQMEEFKAYREAGVNPLLGCLPMLLQMPFLLGMFYLLKSSFALRGAVFIPGWIDDLSAPDVLFTWGQPIWFIGNELHLLPILTGITMYLQQKISVVPPADPSKLSESQKQQKMMGYMLPVFLTVMFYNLPSGLNIYFMFSNLLGMAQQIWTTKKTNALPKKV